MCRQVGPALRKGDAFHVHIRSGAQDEHEICGHPLLCERRAQGPALAPDRLAHQPAHAIPSHGFPSPAGHRVPNVQRSLFRTLHEIKTERERTADLPATVEHTVECCVAPERLGPAHLPFVADREFLAPSGTPARKHLPPCLGRHARAEAVRIAALPIVGLKCSLHDS
jgi:hypothetical protein